jgi:hypothetical protein
VSELGGGCAAEHCEEPDRVDEMVSCAGIGCSDHMKPEPAWAGLNDCDRLGEYT